MTDFLDLKRKEIADRLKELKPLVDEYTRLEAASQALDGVGTTNVRPAGRRGPGRPPGSRSSTGTRRRRGRRGGNTRANEALALVKGKPGITIPELATAMGIKQNYLYRVMPTLQNDKLVKKQGKGWHPA